MNIFASLKVYAAKWTPKAMVDANGQPVANPRFLSAEEKAAIVLAVVVSSQYGSSVEFTRKVDGGKMYIPLGKDESYSVGDVLDIARMKLLTLEKHGEEDIVRVVF